MIDVQVCFWLGRKRVTFALKGFIAVTICDEYYFAGRETVCICMCLTGRIIKTLGQSFGLNQGDALVVFTPTEGLLETANIYPASTWD